MSDIINNLQPGQPLSDKQKAELAAANLKETNEAHRLAAEQRSRDIAEGRGEPAVSTVANLLKGKLERGEFETKNQDNASAN